MVNNKPEKSNANYRRKIVKMYGGFASVSPQSRQSRDQRRQKMKPHHVQSYVRQRMKQKELNWYGVSVWDNRSCFVKCLAAINKQQGLVRKILKVAFILICLGVCSYQVFEFMQMYFKYPTTVDVEIELLEFSGLPGITVCNRNILRRREACGNEETKNLCRNFTSLNEYNARLFEIMEAMTTSQLKKYGHQLNNFIHSCSAVKEGEDFENDLTYFCEQATWVFNGRLSCFVINDQWNGVSNSTFDFISFAILLDLEEGEYLSKKEEVAADIYVHSSYVIPTPRISGFRAEVDKRYSLGFRKTTLKLLEPPYATMCRNYRRLHKNNPSEASSQTNCFLKCEWELHMERCKCIPPEVPLVENSIKCSSVDQKNCATSLSKHGRIMCDDNCPPDCEVHLYDVSQVNDKIAELRVTLNESSKSYTYVSIDLRSKRQILYSHKPRFTSIELFSYVGGYLSIWLGLSFPLIYGFFETACLFCCLLPKNKKSTAVSSQMGIGASPVTNGNKRKKLSIYDMV